MKAAAHLFLSMAAPLAVAAVVPSLPAPLQAEVLSQSSPGPMAAGGEYRTPLAGEAFHGEVAGRTVVIPSRDRDYVRALNLGTVFFSPTVGDQAAVPFGAFYWLKNKHNWRSRAVVSIFVNEVDISREFGRFKLLLHWDNNTVPFPTAEIVDGEEVESTSIMYGDFAGGVGIGYRLPVAPYQADNVFRLHLLYKAGYLYTGRVDETGADVRLPPSTFVHGFRLRADYDALRRNIMELPHRGLATGAQVEVGRRNHWSDFSFGGTVFRGDKTRDFLKISAFLTWASGLPWLSERHRLTGTLHGGYAPDKSIDRFSAFRLGGGPYPYETDDLYRYWYPGAMFNQFPVSDFAVASLEYRYELLFFLYLHLRATAAQMDRPYLAEQGRPFTQLDFIRDYSHAFSAGITSGLPWDSQLYAEYTWDSNILRNGVSGSSILLLWSKSF